MHTKVVPASSVGAGKAAELANAVEASRGSGVMFGTLSNRILAWIANALPYGPALCVLLCSGDALAQNVLYECSGTETRNSCKSIQGKRECEKSESIYSRSYIVNHKYRQIILLYQGRLILQDFVSFDREKIVVKDLHTGITRSGSTHHYYEELNLREGKLVVNTNYESHNARFSVSVIDRRRLLAPCTSRPW
jgi:hypothetical protein